MKLTRRELEACKLIAWGASDKEVSLEMGIALETARTYRGNILEKTGSHNATDLCRWYFENVQGFSFGMNPRQIRHIALSFIFLIFFGEFNLSPIVRVRNFRPRTEQTARVRRNENELMFA